MSWMCQIAFFFSSRRRHTRYWRDWSSDVCSSDLGEVEFTVMQSNLAALKEAEFSNLKVRPVLGRKHGVAWAVRKNSPELLAELNRWIEDEKNESLRASLDRKSTRLNSSHANISYAVFCLK